MGFHTDLYGVLYHRAAFTRETFDEMARILEENWPSHAVNRSGLPDWDPLSWYRWPHFKALLRNGPRVLPWVYDRAARGVCVGQWLDVARAVEDFHGLTRGLSGTRLAALLG